MAYSNTSLVATSDRRMTVEDLLATDPTPTRTCDLLENCPEESAPIQRQRAPATPPAAPLDTVIIIRGREKTEEAVNPAPDCIKMVRGPAIKYFDPATKQHYTDPFVCQNANQTNKE